MMNVYKETFVPNQPHYQGFYKFLREALGTRLVLNPGGMGRPRGVGEGVWQNKIN